MPGDEVTTRPVGGRYELRELLGRGGMGSVWRAEDLLLQRPVAVKRVELPMHLPDQERDALRQRVLREARAAARVSHQRLVTIFDVVEEEGIVFLVQELVDAPTLKALVNEKGPLPPAEVAAIGRQLVDGVAAAHRNGVVHRDVKPSNVMVLPDGGIKLADFGIASLHGDPQITATGVVVGSPAYMAPEQAVGNKAGPAADLWSVGATLYFAVEGEPPFGRADTLSTLTAVVNEPHREMAIAGPLAPLLARLLAKEPDARPDAAEVSRLLAGIGEADRSTAALTEVRSTGHVAPPPPAATTVAAAVPTRHVVEREEVAEPAFAPSPARPRRRGLAVATALVLLLLLGGFALAAALGREGDTDERAGAGATTETEPTPSGEVEAPDEATDGRDVPTEAAESTGTTTEGPATTAAPATTQAPATTTAAVPNGWKTYRDPESGYAIAHPANWRVIDRSGNRTDFTDPSNGTYLRVDWTDEPNESAQADWERQSKAFGSSREAYQEVRIEPTRFAGSDNASLWEYTYREGGAALHAYNLGFVVGGDDGYGFALNFQTREENWASSQQLWEQLKAGYRAPS